MLLWLLKLGITMLIHNKDDIQFVTEFSCFLGHLVSSSLCNLIIFKRGFCTTIYKQNKTFFRQDLQHYWSDNGLTGSVVNAGWIKTLVSLT